MKYFLQIALVALLPLSSIAAESKIELPPLIAAEVLHGELPNGLRYFIKANKQPAGKVEMRLLVNVGSISEADDERGFAHMLEHMAFRRTKNFTQGQVQAFVEGQGMRIGHDTNAFTFPEYTIFQLGVSKDQSSRALSLLADWAVGGIDIDAVELSTEKNVVLEEGRQRDESGDYFAGLMNVLYPKSIYAQRLPIGDIKVIDTVTAEKLRAFYQREYQAQRMTLMIAGDIDAESIETKIKTLFASAKAGTAPREYTVPATDQGMRLFSHRNVSWLAQPVVRWGWLLPVESMGNADAALRDFQYELLSILLRQRLLTQSQQPNSALLDVFTLSQHGNVPTRHTEFGFEATVKETKLKDALREMYRELERAKRFGFTEAEVKTAFETRQKQAVVNLDNQQWAGQMLNMVRFGESLRMYEDSNYSRKRFMAATTPADLQQQLQRLLKDPNQVAYILLPKTLSSFSMFSESAVKNMVAEVQAEPMLEQQQNVVKPLMSQLPISGKIIKATPHGATGGQLLQLSNGIEVLTIPPKRGVGQVGFSAMSRGGLLSINKEQLPAARVLGQYLLRAGLGELTIAEVNQYLALHPAMLTSVIDIDQFGLIGDAGDVNDLETLLQMQYLAFTSRRNDDAARKASIDAAYQYAVGNYNSIFSVLNARRFGENWPSPESWRTDYFETDLKQLGVVRDQWLANPAAFRFVITGVYQGDNLNMLIERYIASLPRQAIQSVNLAKLSQITPSSIQQKADIKGAMRILQAGVNVAPSSESAVMAESIAELVRMRLNEALRVVAGNTYGVHVWTNFNESQGALINVLFQHDTAQCVATAKTVELELARLINEAPSSAEVQSVRDKMLKLIADTPQNPMMYANTMAVHWGLNQGRPLEEIPDFADYTPEMMHRYIKSWLAPERWASGVFNCSNEIDFDKLKSAAVVK